MAEGEERIHETLPAWGRFRVASPLSGGHRHSVLLIELNGKPAVAKTTRRSREQVDWLVPVLESAERAGFTVPRYLSASDGSRVVNGVTVETWLGGSSLSPSDLSRAHSMVRKFHSLTWDLPQRPGFRSSLELLEHDRGGDVDLTSMPEPLVFACRSTWRLLSTSSRSVVHGDLNPSNLLTTDDGRIGLIDWDEARVDSSPLDEAALLSGDRLIEDAEHSAAARAFLAWEVAASWHLEPGYARKLSDDFMRLIGA